MKVVILAGGYGTHISEESHLKPKPMIEIGNQSILWHIMKSYSYYGYHEFIICAGYKQHVMKEYFADYFTGQSHRSPQQRSRTLARDGQLSAYTYAGFWQCMDALRDKLALEELIAAKKAPWMRW